MRKRDVYRIALVGAIVIVLLNTLVAATALRSMLDRQQWLLHTQVVISATEQMLARIRNAESSARGYVLTGNAGFEDQYKTASQRVQESIENIRQLTSDSPQQQANIADLRKRIAAKMTVLDSTIALRHGHQGGSIDADLISGVVADTPGRMDDVVVTVRAMLAEENRLLAIRTNDTRFARNEVWVTFIVASLLDVILLIVAFEFLVRLSKEREIIEENTRKIAELNSALQIANGDLENRVILRTKELQISNQELEAFSYSVSHDLRAPLRTIDGFSLALQEDFSDKLNEEGRDYIVRVRNGVQRMGTLIDSLLQLSRVTRSDLADEDVDLSQLATSVFRDLQSSEPDRQVICTAEPDVHAKGDSRLLRIALENLIGNAWKFTSKVNDAQIKFGSYKDAADNGDSGRSETVYFIQDNGAGFDMQYVDRLFTAFQRLHGDRDFKGSGIGLATVSRIIRRHHGTIGAESEVGHGATFFFTLANGTTAG